MFKNLIPWEQKSVENPMVSFRRRMDRVFEDFFDDFPIFERTGALEGKSEFMPKIDVSETDKEIHVSAELPGMMEKDIEVTLENNVLTIKGEKKHEEEKKDKNYHYVERRYGSFFRSVPIPQEVETEKIAANFKNGVLTISAPKKESSAKSAKIKINTDK